MLTVWLRHAVTADATVPNDVMECASVHQPLALGQAATLERALVRIPTRALAASQARRPIMRPRTRPAWSAASLKVGQERVTSVAGVVPGSTRELPAGTVTEAPKASEPV
jgi:hypothetical protein